MWFYTDTGYQAYWGEMKGAEDRQKRGKGEDNQTGDLDDDTMIA
jgi:hypothetical protein